MICHCILEGKGSLGEGKQPYTCIDITSKLMLPEPKSYRCVYYISRADMCLLFVACQTPGRLGVDVFPVPISLVCALPAQRPFRCSTWISIFETSRGWPHFLPLPSPKRNHVPRSSPRANSKHVRTLAPN